MVLSIYNIMFAIKTMLKLDYENCSKQAKASKKQKQKFVYLHITHKNTIIINIHSMKETNRNLTGFVKLGHLVYCLFRL